MHAERLARLQAMGVGVWMPRPLGAETPAGTMDSAVRIRLGAGTGDWLLVTRAPVPERWSRLVEDITAAIDPARCRFGRWADNRAAGTGLEELEARGIHWVLSLGAPPVDCDWPGLLVAAELETLARDADARRALWRLIEKPLIATSGLST